MLFAVSNHGNSMPFCFQIENEPVFDSSFLDNREMTASRIERNGAYPNCMCSNCKTVFHSVEERRLHQEKCSFDFKCSYCGKAYRSKSGLHNHKLNMHEQANQRYQCHECDKRFHSKLHFEGHMNVHFKLQPYKCKVCGLGFAYKFNLTSHEKSRCTGGRGRRCRRMNVQCWHGGRGFIAVYAVCMACHLLHIYFKKEFKSVMICNHCYCSDDAVLKLARFL